MFAISPRHWSILAIGLIAAPASAMDWKNDHLSVSLSLFMQARVEGALEVRDRDGERADLAGVTTDDPQWVDASFRRLRFTMRGSYYEDTRFNLVLSADRLGEHRAQTDSDGNVTGMSANDGGNIGVLYAWVSHRWQLESGTHTLKFGKDFPFFNPSIADSSARMLFPSNRPTAVFSPDNTVGLSYTWEIPVLRLGFDVMNPRNDSRNIFASMRAETSLKPEWRMTRTESMLGREGFGHVIGLAAGLRTDDHSNDDGYIQAGIDYNLHWNAVTANVDAIIRRAEANADKNLKSESASQWGINLQAGYAIPRANGQVIEPALRVAFFDMGHSQAPDISSASFESVDSGIQMEAGLNYYIQGHNHKFQIAYCHWQANRGDARKHVLRLQHQLLF
ncbi:MAG: hypothetical protein EA401_00780 [Planctomycetota bacterium]|nr:MAG: hypothetical protein EA401_00780 [Planctomycetota bacterium]